MTDRPVTVLGNQATGVQERECWVTSDYNGNPMYLPKDEQPTFLVPDFSKLPTVTIIDLN